MNFLSSIIRKNHQLELNALHYFERSTIVMEDFNEAVMEYISSNGRRTLEELETLIGDKTIVPKIVNKIKQLLPSGLMKYRGKVIQYKGAGEFTVILGISPESDYSSFKVYLIKHNTSYFARKGLVLDAINDYDFIKLLTLNEVERIFFRGMKENEGSILKYLPQSTKKRRSRRSRRSRRRK